MYAIFLPGIRESAHSTEGQHFFDVKPPQFFTLVTWRKTHAQLNWEQHCTNGNIDSADSADRQQTSSTSRPNPFSDDDDDSPVCLSVYFAWICEF